MMARVPAEDVGEVQADWKNASVEDKKQMVWDVRKLLDEQVSCLAPSIATTILTTTITTSKRRKTAITTSRRRRQSRRLGATRRRRRAAGTRTRAVRARYGAAAARGATTWSMVCLTAARNSV